MKVFPVSLFGFNQECLNAKHFIAIKMPPHDILELTLISGDPGVWVQNNELRYQVLDFAAD